MIVMINGAFGSGKTSAAHRLQSLIPDSMIFDPEEVGYMLRNIIPEEIRLKEEQTDDFQDLELWRILVVKTAEELKRRYNKSLIVPMTLYKAEPFDYIFDGLKRLDPDFFHFCLIASEMTIRKRVESRGDLFGEWYQEHTRRAVPAFDESKLQEQILTDHREPSEIVGMILDRIYNR